MTGSPRFRVPALLLLCLSLPSTARADGGTLRLAQQQGPYRIAVFTDPTPLRTGPVDVSVLLQDASTGEPFPEVPVLLELTPEDRPEETLRVEAGLSASNRLFRAATVDLGAGRWQVAVRVFGPAGEASAQVEMEVGPPPPRWQEVWPWIAWPLIPIGLFALRERLKANGGVPDGSRHTTRVEL
jgi:hypothetical protein